MRRDGTDLLFCRGDLHEYLDEQRRRMRAEVDHMSGDELLRRPSADLVSALAPRYACAPLQLQRDDTTTSEHEVRIPIEQMRDGRLLYGEDVTTVQGHCIQFHVPFTGNPDLFHLRGSMTSFNPPRAEVGHGELVYSYQFVAIDQGKDIAARFEQHVTHTEQLVQNGSILVKEFNERIPGEIQAAIERRRAKLLEARNLVASLRYPMRRRTDAPHTFAAPSVQKRITAVAAATVASSAPPFRPEPALAEAHYEDILRIIASMALVLERSPGTFKALGEEDIRNHFLVQLNGQYEGSASGETFNGNGKTDILVREENKNIFIAECKFWRGPAKFIDGIDQLLGYTSWRDTKTALVVFNRDAQMSTVLEQIPRLIASHQCFKRQVAQSEPGRFRAVLRQPSDPDRELMLTVLVFDVPK